MKCVCGFSRTFAFLPQYARTTGMSTAAVLSSITLNINIYGTMVLFIVGIISSALNLLVFLKASLRKNPCTIYLIAINILNVFYVSWTNLVRIFKYSLRLDPSITDIIFCRFLFYSAFLLSNCESTYFIVASIDRVLITSSNANIRARSTPRLAITSLAIITLFYAIAHIHAFFFIDILRFGPYYSVCYYRPGPYTTFLTIYSIGYNGIIIISLMIIFGLWALTNVRRLGQPKQQTAGQPAGAVPVGRPNTLQPKDRQLIRMLMAELVLYIICKCPVQFVSIYNEITKYQVKSGEQSSIEQSILQLTYVLFFVENCVGAYVNILVSKTFRTELKDSFQKVFLYFRRFF